LGCGNRSRIPFSNKGEKTPARKSKEKGESMVLFGTENITNHIRGIHSSTNWVKGGGGVVFKATGNFKTRGD